MSRTKCYITMTLYSYVTIPLELTKNVLLYLKNLID